MSGRIVLGSWCRRLLLVCGALCALAASEGTASATPTWLPPVDVSATGQNAFRPHVAFDAAGDSVAVWIRSNGTNNIVQAAIRPAGGSFAPVVDLSAAGQNANQPRVSISPAGDAIVVWQRSNGTNTIV